jgi:esterase
MKLFFRKYGEGPPLVILHGLYGSSDNWVTIAKKISGSFTVLLPDQRNHGVSPHSEVHDFNSMSNDLFEFVTGQGLTSFFLAGHSMGGKTAAYFAMKWPEMIEGLVIADISPFTSDVRESAGYSYHYSILKTMNDIDLWELNSRTDVDRLLAEKIMDEKIRGFLMKNLKRNAKNHFEWKINVSALLANLEHITAAIPQPADEFQQVTGFPVMLLKGEKSDYVTDSDFSDLLRIFPAATMKIIKNAGHWLHADNPYEVTEAFLSLLDK